MQVGSDLSERLGRAMVGTLENLGCKPGGLGETGKLCRPWRIVKTVEIDVGLKKLNFILFGNLGATPNERS